MVRRVALLVDVCIKVCMPRINVYLPEGLYAKAKRAKLNLSEVCQNAIDDELRRRVRQRALERFADELEERFGPATPDEIADAEAWVEEVMTAATNATANRKPRARRPRKSA